MTETEVQGPTVHLGIDEFVLRDRGDDCRIRAVSYAIRTPSGTAVFFGAPLDGHYEHDAVEVKLDDADDADPMYIHHASVPRDIAMRIQSEYLARLLG
jgi:hypothetical protein